MTLNNEHNKSNLRVLHNTYIYIQDIYNKIEFKKEVGITIN